MAKCEKHSGGLFNMSFSNAQSHFNGGDQERGLFELAQALEEEARNRKRDTQQIMNLLQQILDQRH